MGLESFMRKCESPWVWYPWTWKEDGIWIAVEEMDTEKAGQDGILKCEIQRHVINLPSSPIFVNSSMCCAVGWNSDVIAGHVRVLVHVRRSTT